MKKFIIISTCCSLLHVSLNAQNIHDTATCMDTPTVFNVQQHFSDAYWSSNTASNSFNLTSTPTYSEISPLMYTEKPAFIKTVYDDNQNKWYMFFTQISDGSNIDKISRINLGVDPTDDISLDSIFTLPSFTTTYNNYIQGIDIVKDPDSKQWFGFAIRTNKLVRIQFGAYLDNPTPVIDVITLNEPDIWFSHQLTMKYHNNKWHLFFASRAYNGRIYRVDFLNGLSSTPSEAIPIGDLFIDNPMNFSLIEVDGNHYMFITSVSSNLKRYSFGTNLLNTSPTQTGLAVYPGVGRGFHMFKDCSDNRILAYNLTENGELVKYNFYSDITGTPSEEYITTSYGRTGSTTMITYNNKIYLQSSVCHFGDCSILKIKQAQFFELPSSGSNAYNKNNAIMSFDTEGLKTVKSYVDQGRFSGPYSFCSKIKVNNCGETSIEDGTEHTSYLQQNIPNPSINGTSIPYYIPLGKSGKLIITNSMGQIIKKYDLNNSGEGFVNINNIELIPGIYLYTLYLDGNRIDSKKMVVSK